jgi:hypothetical protein
MSQSAGIAYQLNQHTVLESHIRADMLRCKHDARMMGHKQKCAACSEEA